MKTEQTVIDAADLVAGRLASMAAKELLKGRKVCIVNSEQALISGNPRFVLKTYMEKRERGDPHRGPFYPKTPDRILKRIVRGMLPYKKPRGRQALKNLRVYISVPEELKNKETLKIKEAESRPDKYTSLGKLAAQLGGGKYGRGESPDRKEPKEAKGEREET